MSKTGGGTKRKSSEPGKSDYQTKKIKMVAENESMEKVFSNSHCIGAILSFLPIEDLANVSRASHSVKFAANLVFINVHDATIKIMYDKENFSDQQLVFRQFGSFAKKVKIDMIANHDEEDDIFHDDGNKVLRTIGHFCGPNLKDLTLHGMKIDLSSPDYTPIDRVEVQTLLSTVTKITLMGICIKGGFLRWAKSIRELMIHSSCHMETLPEITTLPQLKILTIGACPTWFFAVGDSFNTFLRCNRSIEDVDYHFFIIGDGHLESICSLPELTHLKLILLDCDDDDLSIIANARKLKKLTVRVPRTLRFMVTKLRKMLTPGCEYTIEDLAVTRDHGHD